MRWRSSQQIVEAVRAMYDSAQTTGIHAAIVVAAVIGLVGVIAVARIEALIAVGSQRSLGFEAAAGTVESGEGEQYPVTGVFRASGPLAGLSDSVLLVGADPAGPLRRISLQVHDPESVPQVADAIRGLLENADDGRGFRRPSPGPSDRTR